MLRISKTPVSLSYLHWVPKDLACFLIREAHTLGLGLGVRIMPVLTMDKNAVALCREFGDKSAKHANFWLGVQFPLKALEMSMII